MGQVFIPDELIAEAMKQGLDLQQEVLSFLRRRVHGESYEAWLAENQEAIDAYNDRITRDGLLLEKYRLF